MTRSFQALGILVILFSSAPCFAGPTVLDGFWQLGDNDPGATPGKIGDPITTDNTGSFPLTRIGMPTYSAKAAPADGSTLSMQFGQGSGYISHSPVTTQTDDFGISAWVNVASPAVLLSTVSPISLFTPGVIAYNGNPLSSGFGLELLANRNGYYFTGSLGGVADVGAFRATPGVWYDLELVRTNGVTTFYVDGKAIASSLAAPRPAVGHFQIGSPQSVSTLSTTDSLGVPLSPIALPVPMGSFHGLIDEVQVFSSFGVGLTPSTAAVPEPATALLLALGVILAYPRWRARRRRRLTG